MELPRYPCPDEIIHVACTLGEKPSKMDVTAWPERELLRDAARKAQAPDETEMLRGSAEPS